GKLRQDGDLAQMIWNVPEVIGKLSEMVALAAGDIIMTGTPSGVAATVPGDKLECEIEGVGSLTVTIGPPARGRGASSRAQRSTNQSTDVASTGRAQAAIAS